MNKTVQSILSLTAVSLLLIVITFFFGGLGFGRLFGIYGIMEDSFLGMLMVIDTLVIYKVYKLYFRQPEKQYKAYNRNSLIGICTLVFSGGILVVVYLIFLILAYRNVAKFYKALERNEDETALFNALGVLAYFHLKGRMKEELKGIR